VLICADGEAWTWSCIAADLPPTPAVETGRVVEITKPGEALGLLWVERCELQVGDQQTGVVEWGAAQAIIARNHVMGLLTRDEKKLPWPGDKKFEDVAKRLAGEMLSARAETQSMDTEQIEMRKANEVVNVPSDASTARMWRSFSAAKEGKEATDVGAGAESFAMAALQAIDEGKATGVVTQGVHEALDAAATGTAAIVVVAKTSAETAQIIDNTIEGSATCVRTDTADQNRDALIRHVLIARNVLSPLIPGGSDATVAALELQSAASLDVTGNQATLFMPTGAKKQGTKIGVLVFGRVGPYMVVRQTSLDGFDVGVHIEAKYAGTKDNPWLWLVAETMAANIGVSPTPSPNTPPIVIAPPDVIQERNFAT